MEPFVATVVDKFFCFFYCTSSHANLLETDLYPAKVRGRGRIMWGWARQGFNTLARWKFSRICIICVDVLTRLLFLLLRKMLLLSKLIPHFCGKWKSLKFEEEERRKICNARWCGDPTTQKFVNWPVNLCCNVLPEIVGNLRSVNKPYRAKFVIFAVKS